MKSAPIILIVDDNRALAENLQEILEDEAVEVRVAASGESAIEALGATSFSLVITDVRMPGMDGVQMLKIIQRRWPSLPVIVMTAYSSDSLLEEAAAAGALGILYKPLDVDTVINLVRRVAEPNAAVLLVEDERRLRINLAEALLDVASVVPHVAPDIATADRLASQIPFRVAIIDIHLPDGDGLAYGHSLRQRLGEDLMVIYITGYGAEVRNTLFDELELEQSRVRLLEKPFSPHALLELVRRAI